MNADALIEMIDKSAWAVVDKLAAWDEKFDHVRGGDRAHQRQPCRLVMTAWFADDNWKLETGETRIWVRNISRGGVNFVLNEQVDLKHVCIQTSAEIGQTRMRGEIVNLRETHDGFYEYGVRFVGRVPPSQ